MNISTSALRFILRCILITGLCLPAYALDDDQQTLGQKIDSAVASIEKFSTDKKDKTIEQVDDTLNSVDKKIKTLEQQLAKKWASMDTATQNHAQKSLATLHKKRDQLASWMNNMSQSTSSAWRTLKGGVSGAYSALEGIWKDEPVLVKNKTI